MIPIRITLVKWWWTTRNGRRERHSICLVLLNHCVPYQPTPGSLVHLVVFVPTTTAKQILFLNHMNKKVEGGKHTVLIHYVDISLTNSAVIVLWNPFKWDILWFILIKNLVICVPTTLAKQIWFCNHRKKTVLGGKHNVLVQYLNVCASDLSGVVLWNRFKWDILLCVHIQF